MDQELESPYDPGVPSGPELPGVGKKAERKKLIISIIGIAFVIALIVLALLTVFG